MGRSKPTHRRLSPQAGQRCQAGDRSCRRRGEPLDRAWIAHWRASWPRCGRRQRQNLEALVDLLQHHRTGLGLDRSRTTHLLLQGQLNQLFRRCLLQPATLFVYLCLLATDLERLRSALISRALFTLDGGS